MITNVSLVTVWVADQDEAKAFYVDRLGFRESADITMGDGYRWCTVIHPDHPELEITLAVPGPPLDDESAAAVRTMMDKGALHAVGLATDDCRKTFEELAEGGTIVMPFGKTFWADGFGMLRDRFGVTWMVNVEHGASRDLPPQ